MRNKNYDYVDLDLPSGTLWATCNVGANNPWEYGKYFAWGDTEGYYDNEEHYFFWNAYKWCNGTYDTLTKYNHINDLGSVDNKWVLDIEDDAANVHMGGDWHIPSKKDFEELVDNTNHEWVTNYQGSGVNGRLFLSKEDVSKFIFIPASGYRWDSSVYDQNDDADLWASAIYRDNVYHAEKFGFCSENYATGDETRYLGFCVRGVKK